jgi:hypothetical protein
MRGSMRECRWIGALALLGVLLHAAAVVQHAVRSSGAAFAHGALLADLGLLCRGGVSPRAAVAAELPRDVAPAVPPALPHVPPPVDAQMSCPVCCGPGPAVALPVPEVAGLVPPPPLAVPVPHAGHRTPPARHAACPPARGPPAAA